MSLFFQNLFLKLRNLAPYQKNRIILSSVVMLFLVFIVLGILGVFSPESKPEITPGKKKIDLVFWSIFDSKDAFRPVMQAYKAENTNVTIKYEQKDYTNYRELVADLLSAKRGPDIYVVHHTWLPLERDRLVPMNDMLDIDAPLVISKYPDVFRFDFVDEELNQEPKIYALPLSIDTLALYYNKDYFNSNNIVTTPRTWEEFVDVVKKLRRIDEAGNIIVAGAAIGSGSNERINRSMDILSLLMMQSGAEMNDDFGRITFDKGVVDKDGQIYYPAKEALSFYTSFSNPLSENYTWTWPPGDKYSIDSFAEGSSAMMINYSYHRSTVREKNPLLNFSVAPIPQAKDSLIKINYPSYWGYAVPKVSQYPDVAWDFINFMAQEDNVKIYLDKTDRPTALKSLITYQQKDSELAVFSSQILSAKSWKQPDFFEVQKIFENAIDTVLSGEKSTMDSMKNAASQINAVLFSGLGL